MSKKQSQAGSKSGPTKADASNDRRVSQGRHEYRCAICAHKQREEIEQEFLNWASPSRIAAKYSVTRESVYRHAWALGLMEKRRRNIRAALEKIIEKADSVEVNANAVVTAVSALARINSLGQWVERRETVNVNALFDRMSAEELEAYARDAVLPKWFQDTVATQTNFSSRGDAGVTVTGPQSPGHENER